MKPFDVVGTAQNRIRAMRSKRLGSYLEPALRSAKGRNIENERLLQIGSLVGLSEGEINSATEHYRGAFSRFCSRMLLVLVLGFFTLILLSFLAADSGWVLWDLLPEEPITTYTPGTRYGSIHPSDFRSGK
ncbi:MAG: hypothetical protein ACFFED_04800 [Candidatus Thorarchaeota archaeon]